MRFRPIIAVAVFTLATGVVCAQNNVPLSDLKIRAEAGDKTATRQMAEAYYLGKGAEQDFKQAAFWYEKLAKQGDDVAQEQLKMVSAGMTSEQIKDAENQAKDWMAKAKKTWNGNSK